MAAPSVIGKYCTRLKDLQIGDYIQCVYEAPYANNAGYFSQLGVKDPKITVTTTTTTDGVKGDPVVTHQAYSELPTTPGVSGISGFFYLIKVDYGQLCADRIVQQQISWETLNESNYIYGGAFDAVSAKTRKTVDIVITHKDYESTDKASDSTTTDNQFDSAQRYVTTVRTQVVPGSAKTDTAEAVQTTTTVTTTRIDYAYIDYSPKDNVTGVASPDQIDIGVGDTATTVATKLTTIPKVTCTILSKDGSTSYTKDITVKWDSSTFEVNKPGRQIIYGYLSDDDLEADPSNPITNTDNLRASVVVNTVSDNIKSVNAIAPVTVKFGTTQSKVLETLSSKYPTVTIQAEKADGSTYDKSNVGVTWDTSTYTTRTYGKQSITGTIADISTSGISNTNEINATVEVDTAYKGSIDSYEAKSITIENGATNASALLGTTILANTTEDFDNPEENKTSETFNVLWDVTQLKNTKPTGQQVTGTIIDDISMYNNVAGQPTAIVYVKPTIDSFESLTLTVPTGTTENDMKAQLAVRINANTTTSSGAGTLPLNIVWDTSSYKTTAGTYTISGTISSNISEYTNKAGNPKYTVIVQDSTTTDSSSTSNS